jgi:hypothetical protein
MTDKIKVFKLLSGEDLICEVSASVENQNGKSHHEIINAATLVLQETEKGMSVGLAAYMPYCNGTVILYQSAIVAESTPEPHMLQEYKRVFGKIMTSSPSIIMP